MKTGFRNSAAALCAVLLLTLIISPLSVYAEAPYAEIVTASDFQSGSLKSFSALTECLLKARESGVGTPDGVIFGGDYSIPVDADPTAGIVRADRALKAAYPNTDTDRVTFIQGNHDLTADGIAPTGLCDMGSYFVYVLNEDSFPGGQASLSNAEADVKKLADNIRKSFDSIVGTGRIKPVFVASHVPLHHYSRVKYGENLYSKYVFDVLNEYGRKLDIIFLFGHNHTGSYDDYIGGSLNFLPKGGSIRIPVPDKVSQGANGYTSEVLNFTYMNYGYLGDVNSTTVNIRAVSVIQLYNSSIRVTRFSTDGACGTENVARINKLENERGIKAAGTGYVDFGSNYITGIKENASSLDSYVKTTKAGCRLKYGEIKTGAKVQVIKNSSVCEEYTIAVTGDVNADGKINSADALMILNNSAGRTYLAGAGYVSADTDRNGAVNSSDALTVLKYSVGITKSIV